MAFMGDQQQQMPQFITLGQYLDANRPAVANTASGVAGVVDDATKSTQGNIDQGSAAFPGQVQSGVQDSSAPLHYDGAGTGFYAQGTGKSYGSQVYKGPGQFDTNPYVAGVTGAQRLGGMTGNQSGLQQLIGQKYGENDNNANFDAGLLGADATARGTLGGAQGRASALTGYLDNAAQVGNGYVKRANDSVGATNATYASHVAPKWDSTPSDLEGVAQPNTGAGQVIGRGMVGFGGSNTPMQQRFKTAGADQAQTNLNNVWTNSGRKVTDSNGNSRSEANPYLNPAPWAPQLGIDEKIKKGAAWNKPALPWNFNQPQPQPAANAPQPDGTNPIKKGFKRGL